MSNQGQNQTQTPPLDSNELPYPFLVIFYHHVMKEKSWKRNSRTLLPWCSKLPRSKYDKYVLTGLALEEGPNAPKGIPLELAMELSGKCNPMCWVYAMHLYLKKAWDEARRKPVLKNIIIEDIEKYTYDECQRNRKKEKEKQRWMPLKSKDFISYIPHKPFWNYGTLHTNAKNDINRAFGQGTGGCSSASTSKIERFLKQTAHDFCQQYVQSTGGIRSGKQVWKADPRRLQYFRDTWKKRISASNISNEIKQKEDFMEIVIAEMQDANENANRHLTKRTKKQQTLYVLTLVTALCSASAGAIGTVFSEGIKPEVSWVSVVQVVFLFLTMLGAGWTAWQVAAQDSMKEAEETWLRQKVYYAKLQCETQRFCDSLAPYTDSNDEKNFKKYIEEIEKLRKKDWENFFHNMNCVNDFII